MTLLLALLINDRPFVFARRLAFLGNRGPLQSFSPYSSHRYDRTHRHSMAQILRDWRGEFPINRPQERTDLWSSVLQCMLTASSSIVIAPTGSLQHLFRFKVHLSKKDRFKDYSSRLSARSTPYGQQYQVQAEPTDWNHPNVQEAYPAANFPGWRQRFHLLGSAGIASSYCTSPSTSQTGRKKSLNIGPVRSNEVRFHGQWYLDYGDESPSLRSSI